MAHRLRGKILAFIRSFIVCVTPTASFSWGL